MIDYQYSRDPITRVNDLVLSSLVLALKKVILWVAKFKTIFQNDACSNAPFLRRRKSNTAVILNDQIVAHKYPFTANLY